MRRPGDPAAQPLGPRSAGRHYAAGLPLLQQVQHLACETQHNCRRAEQRAQVRPSLAGCRERLQELERQMAERGEVQLPQPAPAHRRAAERARELFHFAGPISRPEHDLGGPPDPDTSRERWVRGHEKLCLSRALEEAHSTCAQTAYLKHCQNFEESEATGPHAVLDLCLGRAPIGVTSGSTAPGGAAFGGDGPAPFQRARPDLAHTAAAGGAGYAQSPLDQDLTLDPLVERYAQTMRACFRDRLEGSTGAARAQLFSRLAADGPAGPRRPDHRASAEALWDCAAAVVRGCSAALPPQGVERAEAVTAACREHLEAECRRLHGADTRVPTAEVVQSIVEDLRRTAHLAQGPNAALWAQAFFSLRMGDGHAAADVLRYLPGGEQLAVLATNHWPPCRFDGGEALPVPSQPAAQQLRYQACESPYQRAVHLLLSRSAAAEQADAVWRDLGEGGLAAAPDAAWLLLALAADWSPEGAGPEVLRMLQQGVSSKPQGKLVHFNDPLLYCRMAMWSQQPELAVEALLQPQCAELAEFYYDGMHLALLLTSAEALQEDCVRTLVRKTVERHVTFLAPVNADAALAYLRALPERAMEQSLAAVCADRDTARVLLGGLEQDATGEPVLSNSAAARQGFSVEWRGERCAQAAATAAQRGRMVGAAERLLVAYYLARSVAPSPRDPLCLLRARDLHAMLCPRLAAMIEELCDSDAQRRGQPTFSHGGSSASGGWAEQERADLQRAAELVHAHRSQLMESVGFSDWICGEVQRHDAEAVAFEQLYWMAVLCTHTQPQTIEGAQREAWEAAEKTGLLPHVPDQSRAMAEQLNLYGQAGTVCRAVHWAVLRVLDLVQLGLQRLPQGQGSGGQAQQLRLVARAVIDFRKYLREPPCEAAHAALLHRIAGLEARGI